MALTKLLSKGLSAVQVCAARESTYILAQDLESQVDLCSVVTHRLEGVALRALAYINLKDSLRARLQSSACSDACLKLPRSISRCSKCFLELADVGIIWVIALAQSSAVLPCRRALSSLQAPAANLCHKLVSAQTESHTCSPRHRQQEIANPVFNESR